MSDKNMPSTQNWRTPPDLFRSLDREFGFEIDVAADDANKLCGYALTEENSALENSWGRRETWAFCNPPYNNIAPFLAKAVEQLAFGVGSVFLIPASVELKYWAETVWPRAAEIRLITGRLSFCHPDTGKPIKGNRYNSAIVVFRPFWPGREPYVYRVDHYWAGRSDE